MNEAKTGGQLQNDVHGAFEREPLFDAAEIGVTADHGIVHLGGHVLGVTARQAVEEAALRVEGVTAVLDELEIRLECSPTGDSMLASLAVEALDRHFGGSGHPVKVVVRGGRVRLVGLVSGPIAREAEAAVLRAIGTASFEDTITVESAGTHATSPTPERGASGPVDPHDDRRDEVGPHHDRPSSGESRIIVSGVAGPGQVGLIASVHHRDFPEIRGEGETPARGVNDLIHVLNQARDQARDRCHLEAFERAIDDVRAFRMTLYEGAEGGLGR